MAPSRSRRRPHVPAREPLNFLLRLPQSRPLRRRCPREGRRCPQRPSQSQWALPLQRKASVMPSTQRTQPRRSCLRRRQEIRAPRRASPPAHAAGGSGSPAWAAARAADGRARPARLVQRCPRQHPPPPSTAQWDASAWHARWRGPETPRPRTSRCLRRRSAAGATRRAPCCPGTASPPRRRWSSRGERRTGPAARASSCRAR